VPAMRQSGDMPVLLGLRFLVELAMLSALAWGAWFLTDTAALSVVLAVVAPVLAAVVWGRWVAPRAAHRLRDPARLGVEITLFAVAFVLVAAAEPRPANLLFGLAMWLAFLATLPARHVEVSGARTAARHDGPYA
jgi:hypothetical protein